MKKVELLSPAGNMDSLRQAVMNGADAVYLGGKKFGARKFANNFDSSELISAIKFCHLYGVKVYVTVNTMIYNNEFEEVMLYISFLHQNNVDAVIVQDIGLIEQIRKRFPNLEVHASTQAHNNNSFGISFLKNLGVSRVVLARELSLEDIQKIDVDVEKEVFVHGALCVAYSGCCLFSSMNGGRSGNRGECVGSCRLPYELYKNGKIVKTNGKYLLSTKSLCTLDKVAELIESGVSSFKIEGRMKSPEYVGYVTRLYRNKIDQYYKEGNVKVQTQEIDNLKRLYNREFTHGYLFENSLKDIMNIKTSNHIGVNLGNVLEVDKKKIRIFLDEELNQEDGIRFDNDFGMIVNKLYNEKGLLVNSLKKGEIAVVDNKIGLVNAKNVRKTIDARLNSSLSVFPTRKVIVNLFCIAKIGKPLKVIVTDSFNTITTNGSIVETAKNSPTSYDRVKEQLEKLGNTPFECHNTSIEMDDNVFISIKEINELRRYVIEELILKRENQRKKPFVELEVKEFSVKRLNYSKLKLNLLVRTEEQLLAALNNEVNNIYVNDYSLYKKYDSYSNIFYRTSRVSGKFREFKGKNILATELGAIEKYSNDNNVVADYFLNIANINSINLLKQKKISLSTLSVESSIENMKDILLINNNIEIIVYGRIELMVSKYCPLKLLVNKDFEKCTICMKKDKYTFKDQFGNMYPIVNEKHFMHLMHYKNINLIDSIDELRNAGAFNFRIELFDENEKETVQLIKKVRMQYE